MSRQKIIAKLKEKNPQINKKILTNVLDSFFKSISNSLTRGKSVEIRSFGSFFIKQIMDEAVFKKDQKGWVNHLVLSKKMIQYNI